MSVAAGQDTIAAAFATSGKRAALMPYLMGGFPDVETSVRIGEAYADGGADLVELGVPFSDPLADGPVIHAAGTEALRAGATLTGVLKVCEAIACADSSAGMMPSRRASWANAPSASASVTAR